MSLLCHELLGTKSHFDWMLAMGGNLSDSESRTVRTYRCSERPDRIAPGGCTSLEELPFHRCFYLTLRTSHELSDNRGCVTWLRSGRWRVVRDHSGDGPLELDLQWDDATPIKARIVVGRPPAATLVIEG